MRFSDERYVRLYVRDTVTTKLLGWEGRAVWHELLRRFDRAGVIDLNNADPVDAVQLLTDMPPDVVQVGLARLLHTGTVLHIRTDGDKLFAPRFAEAQEARASDAQRKRNQRERVQAEYKLNALIAGIHDEHGALACILYDRDQQRVRITHTNNLNDYLERTAKEEGAHLELLGAFPGGPEIERALHQRFADHRVGRSKWFADAEDIRAYIREHGTVFGLSDELGRSATSLAHPAAQTVTQRDIHTETAAQTVTQRDISTAGPLAHVKHEAKSAVASETPRKDSHCPVTTGVIAEKPGVAIEGTSRSVTRGHEMSRLSPLAVPSLAKHSLRSAARAREGSDLTSRPHPDEQWTDRTVECDRHGYEPSQWVVDRATQGGATPALLEATLAEYRENGRISVAYQSKHDRAFLAFVEHRLRKAPPRRYSEPVAGDAIDEAFGKLESTDDTDEMSDEELWAYYRRHQDGATEDAEPPV